MSTLAALKYALILSASPVSVLDDARVDDDLDPGPKSSKSVHCQQ